MSEWTEGPWMQAENPTSTENGIYSSTGRVIARVPLVAHSAKTAADHEFNDESRANARLIAAAPDMAEAIAATLVDAVDMLPTYHVNMLQAALAKARGDQS